MKTHIGIISLVVISSFIGFTGCKKGDDDVKQTLPEPTQSGKNTLGFEVNGSAWIPSYKCNFGGSSCGEIEAAYGLPVVPENAFMLNANRRLDKLSSFSISVKAGATITSMGEKADSIQVVYTSESWAGSTNPGRFIGPLPGSKFTVTKLDQQAKVIAGEFRLIMADSVNSSSQLILEKGRFDFQFYTCKCSN